MISKKLASIGLAAAFVAVLPAVSAQAQSPRTFVSAAGNDSNPCSFAAPCRHFQAAVNATSAGGEVDALDPAGYSPIIISRAITIEGQGWSYIAPPVGGIGITINAVSGDVVIHGVSLNGAGITGSPNGIVFNSGGSLTVTDCTVQNFIGTGAYGILMQPTTGTFNFAITNTTLSHTFGILYAPGGGTPNANGIIDHVIAINANTGGNGIAFNTESTTGGHLVATISNSIASNNVAGVSVLNAGSPSTISLSIDNLTAGGNTEGILANGTSNVLIGRSVIIGNADGIFNNTSPNTFYTYGNNQINLNTAVDLGGTAPNTTFSPR